MLYFITDTSILPLPAPNMASNIQTIISLRASKTKRCFLSQGSPGSKGVEGSDGDQVSKFSLSIVLLHDVYLYIIGI